MATRMQQRRGTASQWISTNSGNGPILAAGEIGFESDTNKFKVGDGVNHWVDLTYFTDAESITTAIGNLIDGAPAALNTLNELAAALGDDANFLASLATEAYVDTAVSGATFDAAEAAGIGLDWNASTDQFDIDDTVATKTYVGTEINTHSGYTTSVHGIADTAELATKTYANDAVSTHNSDTTSVHGIDNTADLATKSYADNAVSTHNSDTTDVHGITNTSELATKTYANDEISSAITNHNSDTTSVHGIADTSLLATQSYADGAASTAVSTHNSDTTDVHGITDTSALATKTYADGAVSTHNLDTTNIHGIADTSLLVTTTGTQTLSSKTLSGPTITIPSSTTTLYGPSSQAYAGGVDPSQGVGGQSYWNLPIAWMDITGWPNTAEPYVGKTLTISGVTPSSWNGSWIIDSAEIVGSDIRLYSSGFVNNAQQTSQLPTMTLSQVIPSKTVSTTEIGYIDGVTSAIQTQINGKAATSHSHVISDVTDLQSSLDDKLDLAGGTMTGALTLSADPSSSLHAATKQYVDNTASGIVAKPQVLGATTANIDATYSNGTAGVGATLTHNTNGVFPAEAGGASGWAVGKGILVKNQTNKAQNGRYYVSDMGSVSTPYVLTRCTYCDEASEIPGAYIFVQDGTNAGTGWIQVVEDPATFVVGTDNIDVFQFSGSGTITAGTNISVSGNEVSVVATPSLSGVTFSDGTQTKEGVASRTPIIQKTDSYTLSALTERDSLIEVNKSSASTITIPLNATIAYPVGTSIDILQTGTGQVSITIASGGTLNCTPSGGSNTAKLRAQWSSATLFKRAENTWVVMGDLSA